MYTNYICKIATIDEMNIKWDYEINQKKDKTNWMLWKKENIANYQNGHIIPYYGILNGKIICECTAILEPSIIHNGEDLINAETVYLSAFRTIPEYQGKGYFSKLFKYMIKDLKEKGYTKATLGVEPTEIKNKAIYSHYGFNKYIKTEKDTYPDGTEIDVEYYGRYL